MRPGHFYPGDCGSVRGDHVNRRCFNEAGAFLPRRFALLLCTRALIRSGFNEAGAFLPRRSGRQTKQPIPTRTCFNEAGAFLPRRWCR